MTHMTINDKKPFRNIYTSCSMNIEVGNSFKANLVRFPSI